MLATWVDEHLRPRGPCAFCGGDDARHRETDAMVERVAAGEAIDDVAADYGVSIDFVERLVNSEAAS